MNASTHRVRHPLPQARWPSREDAARARWFSPIRLGAKLIAAERTWVPAMVPWRATDDGFVTPEVLDWYARFAEGQPGVLVVEATGIRDIASGPLLRIGHDRFIPGPADARRGGPRAQRGAGRGSSSRSSTSSRSGAAPRRPASSAATWRSPTRCALSSRSGSTTRAGARRPRTTCGTSSPGGPRDARDRAERRASSRPSTTATASGSGTRTCPTSASCRRSSPASSPTRPGARARPASTASSCTTPTPTRWRRSCRG